MSSYRFVVLLACIITGTSGHAQQAEVPAPITRSRQPAADLHPVSLGVIASGDKSEKIIYPPALSRSKNKATVISPSLGGNTDTSEMHYNQPLAPQRQQSMSTPIAIPIAK